jgi:hypothetical protein
VAVEQKGFHRKLTIVLSAGVAGYNSLMQDGEAATVKILEAYKQMIPDLIMNFFQAPQIPEGASAKPWHFYTKQI